MFLNEHLDCQGVYRGTKKPGNSLKSLWVDSVDSYSLYIMWMIDDIDVEDSEEMDNSYKDPSRH